MSSHDDFEFKKMYPFKWFIIENFPFLEDSIDGLTNYQLLSKLGDEINKNRDAINTLGTETENLVEEYNSFYDWFNNLDVQDEINNKLDEMATDGTLENIINQEIFGDIQQRITDLETSVSESIETLERNALYIGNSYTDGYGSTSGSDGLFNLTKNLFSSAYKKTSGGIGFLSYSEHNDTFLTMLQNAINDDNIPNDEITDIIIIGAWGDTRALHESTNFSTYSGNVQNAIISFRTLAENNFPNLKRICYTLAESRAQKVIDSSSLFDDAFWIHNRLGQLLPKNGIEYIGWIGFNILLQSTYFSSDHYHPNNNGYRFLASMLKTALNGNIHYVPIKRLWGGRETKITPGSQLGGFITLTPDRADFNIQSITLAEGSTPDHSENMELFNFANNLDFSLPMPTGQESNFNLENGFTCTTQYINNESFSYDNNYNGRIQLKRNTSNPDSLIIQCQSLGASKTVTGTPTAFSLPSNIGWDLSFQM